MGKSTCCSKSSACCNGDDREEQIRVQMSRMKSDALERVSQMGAEALAGFGYSMKEFFE